jgi:adenine-specific DNA methylase
MRDPYEFRYRQSGKPKRVAIKVPSAQLATRRVSIHNRSSEDLSLIPNQSVDLILSDPPYYDNLPYSELSDFYHVWLKKLLGKLYVGHSKAHTPLQGSLFAGRRQGHGTREEIVKAYTTSLVSIFKECGRVAKADARFIFTFHHRDSMAWSALGKALLSSPFRILKVFPVRSEGRSGLHNYDGTIKWDSVFICSKKARRKYHVAGPRRSDSIERSSWLAAGKWQNYIRQSGLDFGWADRSSLAMSLALQKFSSGRLSPTGLLPLLQRMEIRSDSLVERVQGLTHPD